jgi:hypothetical protein
MTSQTTAKTAPVDLRLLLRAALVDLRKPISAWAAGRREEGQGDEEAAGAAAVPSLLAVVCE